MKFIKVFSRKRYTVLRIGLNQGSHDIIRYHVILCTDMN